MYFVANNRLWTIQYTYPQSDELMRSDGTYSIGCADKSNQKIFIADNLSEELEEKVICHEVCHAFVMSYNLYMSIEEEERLCNFVADYGKDIVATTNRIIKKWRKAI